MATMAARLVVKNCQQLSDTYGTFPGNWAKLDKNSNEGKLWLARKCETKPKK